LTATSLTETENVIDPLETTFTILRDPPQEKETTAEERLLQ
jgi:hypothetical protein